MREITLFLILLAVQFKVFVRIMNTLMLSIPSLRKKLLVQILFFAFMMGMVPWWVFYNRHTPAIQNIMHFRPSNFWEWVVFAYFAGVLLLVARYLLKSAISLLLPSHVPAEVRSQIYLADGIDHRLSEELALEEGGLLRWAHYMDDTYRLEVVSKHLRFRKLPRAFDGIRIIQMSDIHYDPMLRPEYFEQAIELVLALQPDLIVLTGDYITRRKYLPAAFRKLSRLQAPLGVFATRGNHDFWTSGQHCKELVERSGMILLDNHTYRLQRDGQCLDLIGIEHPWRPVRNWDDLLGAKDNGTFRMLLSHTPDNIYRAARHGVDLMLSGHTHGGQFRLPGVGAILVPSRYSRRFDAGLFDCRGTVLYVNRGLGIIPPPLRIHCRPEITELVLECK